MPTTPQVNFNFVNENVQASTPLLGVSHVLARTTRGKFNSPDTLITSWPQFQRIYGEEIVPDGSVSNIKKALELGSKLRISRVSGDLKKVEYGVAATLDSATGKNPLTLSIQLFDPAKPETVVYNILFTIKTAEPGSSVIGPNSTGKDFYIRLQFVPGPNYKISLIQAKDPNFTPDSILDSRTLLVSSSFSPSNATNQTPFIDPETLQNFLNSVPFIELSLLKIVDDSDLEGAGEIAKNYSSSGMDGVVALLRDHSNWRAVMGSYDTEADGDNATFSELEDNLDLKINEGNNGGDSTVESWKAAYEAVKGYNDSYQIICSHIHQHLSSTDAVSTLKYISDEVHKYFDQVLYVEVPKYNTDGVPMTPSNVESWLTTNVPIIGSHKTTAYFGGGIKYYNERGSLQNCDVLGTVIGLGDRSASNNGPWFSFAGMNRGVVTSAQGPVIENLGGSGHIETLQKLADWYLNLFVVKDTRTQGKRTMLWHSFTSNPINNSEKFLSIVRLNLYLKKNLLPILESYLEEPNIWDTWSLIYYEAKEILDDLVSRGAMSEYTWAGDQFATSYEELTVNNEADVRQGKYHIKLRYKDIVPMQEIEMNIIIDSASKDISVSTTE